jgi:hypothetical protein
MKQHLGFVLEMRQFWRPVHPMELPLPHFLAHASQEKEQQDDAEEHSAQKDQAEPVSEGSSELKSESVSSSMSALSSANASQESSTEDSVIDSKANEFADQNANVVADQAQDHEIDDSDVDIDDDIENDDYNEQPREYSQESGESGSEHSQEGSDDDSNECDDGDNQPDEAVTESADLSALPQAAASSSSSEPQLADSEMMQIGSARMNRLERMLAMWPAQILEKLIPSLSKHISSQVVSHMQQQQPQLDSNQTSSASSETITMLLKNIQIVQKQLVREREERKSFELQQQQLWEHRLAQIKQDETERIQLLLQSTSIPSHQCDRSL